MEMSKGDHRMTVCTIMNMLIAGMSRYRAWIDRRDINILLASWLLSGLVIMALNLITYTAFFGLYYGTWIGFALIPVCVYLGIAQMTQWRYLDRRKEAL